MTIHLLVGMACAQKTQLIQNICMYCAVGQSPTLILEIERTESRNIPRIGSVPTYATWAIQDCSSP